MKTLQLLLKISALSFLFGALFGLGNFTAMASPTRSSVVKTAHAKSPQVKREMPLETLDKAPLYLEVGEQRVMRFPGLLKYSISGTALKYNRLPHRDEILIKAIRAGVATFSVFTESENHTRVIHVEQKKSLKRSGGLLQAMSRLNSVEVIDEGEHFILRGKVTDAGDARTIAYLEDQYASFIYNETYLPTSELETSRKKLETLLQHYPTVELETQEGVLAVSGGLPSAGQLQALTSKIRAIQPLTRIQISVLKNSNPTIYFKVFLLEVKKALLNKLGTDWASEAHPGVFQLASPKFLIQNTIDLSIEALSQKGLVRVLSSPELVVRAPGQAELFAGGELPIKQRSKFSDSLTWKQFGLSLKLDVTEFGGEKVRLNIETEMSHLDRSVTVDDIPSIQSNRMKTQVDATMSKPLFLSGLIQEELHESARGLPGLREIPVLGKLFGSEDYLHNRSELVAILVPYRNGPQHPMQRISADIPSGYLPLPRSREMNEDKEEIKRSSDFPWNIL